MTVPEFTSEMDENIKVQGNSYISKLDLSSVSIFAASGIRKRQRYSVRMFVDIKGTRSVAKLKTTISKVCK